MSKEIAELAERLLQLANDEGTAQIHDVAIQISAAAERASAVAEPVAWLSTAKNHHGLWRERPEFGEGDGFTVQPLYAHPAPAAPVPASVREALAKAIGMFNDKIHKFDMDIPACLRDGQDRYAENLTAQRERFAGYVSALASLPAPEAAPTREEIIEQCIAVLNGHEWVKYADGTVSPMGAAARALRALKAAPAK